MDVKRVIKEKGYTLERVASSMGITRVTLAQNLSRNPTVKTLQKIADVIGCSVGDFFSDEVSSHSDFSAFVRCAGEHYHADTLDELEDIIGKIRGC